MMWMHSPQSPKISMVQHEHSFNFFSRTSSHVRGSELHWVSLSMGHSKPHCLCQMCPGGGIGFEYAMTANSAWPRSPSTPKEENNNYHLCYVECVQCTFSPLISGGAGYKWCDYPSASFLNLLVIALNLSQLELPWNQEGVLTQLTTCDSSALERGCKC